MHESVVELARRAGCDPHFLAYSLAEYAAANGWDERALGAALGASTEVLAAARLCRAPRAEPAGFREDVDRLAGKFGLDRDALARAARHGQVAARLAGSGGVQPEPAPPFLAARDRTEPDPGA